MWQSENKFQQTPEGKAWLETQHQNPLAPTTKGVLVAGALVGVAAIAYMLYRKPATASTTGIAGATLQLQPGNQAATLPAGGMTLILPAEATWLLPAGSTDATTYNGTSTPLPIPPPPASVAGQSEITPITWKDSNGATQTTNLTLTAAAGGLGRVGVGDDWSGGGTPWWMPQPPPPPPPPGPIPGTYFPPGVFHPKYE